MTATAAVASTLFLILALPHCRRPDQQPRTNHQQPREAQRVASPGDSGYGAAMAARLSKLDVPIVTGRIFFPRPDPGDPAPPGSTDLSIPVEGGAVLHARLHPGPDGGPLVLLFHGNGELVADYDEVTPAYRALGAALLVVDYRGYGRSTGQPTPSRIVLDADGVLDFVRSLPAIRGRRPIVVLGRSLGSAPAIHLAATRGADLAGLILESGFARTLPLLRLVGVPIERAGLTEADGFDNEAAMRRVAIPTLILHADEDTIIPIEDAHLNFEACAARDKTLVLIEGAGHNSIMAYGGRKYWGAIGDFVARL
ncbi:MAG: alpha/beta hydrolase [Deltaproteobacteria bacterium]|nr:alpha/beta hydrolase [Deltaproteobacteria bacterium]